MVDRINRPHDLVRCTLMNWTMYYHTMGSVQNVVMVYEKMSNVVVVALLVG